jgi:hypothetical protein
MFSWTTKRFSYDLPSMKSSIELRLKNFFSAAAVKIGGLSDSLSHRAKHLPKKGLANELIEGLANLGFTDRSSFRKLRWSSGKCAGLQCRSRK